MSAMLLDMLQLTETLYVTARITRDEAIKRCRGIGMTRAEAEINLAEALEAWQLAQERESA